MIRLSRLTDYAVAVLTHMVRENQEIWSAADVADKTGLPLPTVSKILKRLTKASVVSARRGALGGYSLSHDAKNLSIAKVIEAIDGPIAITDCTEGGDHSCRVEPICPMSSGWNIVNRAIRQAMENISLADMARSSATWRAPSGDATVTEHPKGLL